MHGGAPLKSISFCLAIGVCIGLSMSVPAYTQERSAVKQGFELAAKSDKKILLLRPSVRVGAQSTGGLFEPNAEWTEQA